MVTNEKMYELIEKFRKINFEVEEGRESMVLTNKTSEQLKFSEQDVNQFMFYFSKAELWDSLFNPDKLTETQKEGMKKLKRILLATFFRVMAVSQVITTFNKALLNLYSFDLDLKSMRMLEVFKNEDRLKVTKLINHWRKPQVDGSRFLSNQARAHKYIQYLIKKKVLIEKIEVHEKGKPHYLSLDKVWFRERIGLQFEDVSAYLAERKDEDRTCGVFIMNKGYKLYLRDWIRENSWLTAKSLSPPTLSSPSTLP